MHRPRFAPLPPPAWRTCLLGAAILASCGQPQEGSSPAPETVQAALNLARADLAEAPAPAPAERLSPINEAELPERFRTPPSCRLSRDGALLVAAAGGEAAARVDGKLQTIPRGGAVDPSGAFFRGNGITIGIGRIAAVAPAAEVPGVARRAGVTVGGAPKLPLQKFQADWACFW